MILLNKFKRIFFIFLLFSLFFSPKSVWAAFFKLEPTEINKNINETFTIDVYVDPSNQEIRSVDIYLNFDANLITFDSFNPGNFFSTVAHNLKNNELYIYGIMDDVSTKSGLGKVGSITFKGKSKGTGKITFNCEKSVIVKSDSNATNILVCSSNISSNFIIGDSSSSQTTFNPNQSQSNTSDSPPKTLPRSGFIDKMKILTITGLALISLSGLLKIISIKL